MIGNLNEDGYLTATDEEMVEVLLQGGRTVSVGADSV